MYSTPPNRPTDGDLEDDIVTTPSVELKSKNSRIISDVESESIQAELAGLEEVYQRVCRVSKHEQFRDLAILTRVGGSYSSESSHLILKSYFSYSLAPEASVPNRVIAQKSEKESKNIMRKLSSHLSGKTLGETLAAQATYLSSKG